MPFSDAQVLKVALALRPIMGRRIPVLHGICKHIAAWACPKGRPGQGRKLIAPYAGGQIHIDTSWSIDYHLLFRGCHEPLITEAIRRLVRPGAVCLDIGANVGALTLVMAHAAGPAGRVVAIEPHPRIAAKLDANLALNHLAQVSTLRAAISDRDGTATFHGVAADSFKTGISSLHPTAGATDVFEVETLTGASLMQRAGLTSCDFIKIDTEGHDAVVLRQLRPWIERCRPALVFEYREDHWRKAGESLDEVVAWLKGLQYRLRVLRKKTSEPLADPVPDSCNILAEPLAKG